MTPGEDATEADEFTGLVFDEDFVRSGTYEPPARTRLAIARYGGQQTSWRHGAAPESSGTDAAPARPGRAGRAGRAGRPARPARPARPYVAGSWVERLPLIAAVAAVLAAVLYLYL